MFLVEDVRLASPTQLAGTQRHRKFFASPLSKEYVPPRLQAICAEPVSNGESEETMENSQNKQTSVENRIAPVIPYEATVFASHAANVIMQICGERYHATRDEIMSKDRHARIVRARQATYFVTKTVTKWSLPEIGRRLGNKDHTTVLHGLRKLERLRRQSTELLNELDGLVSIARARLEGCASIAVPAVSQQHVPEQQGAREGADFDAGGEGLENRMRLDDQVTEDAAV